MPSFPIRSTPEPKSLECLVTFQEFAGFRTVAKALIDHQDSLFGKWHELYARHFGVNRSLPGQTFDLILGRSLEDSIRSIIDADLDRYTSSLSRVGTKLAARKVPFTEVLTSLHLFWEVVRTDLANVFAFDHVEALTLFSKFCHHKAILIAEAYHRELASSGGVKIRMVTHGRSRVDKSASLFHGLAGQAAPMKELFRKFSRASVNAPRTCPNSCDSAIPITRTISPMDIRVCKRSAMN